MKPEPTRIRSKGTRVTLAKSAAEIYEAAKLILSEGYSKINGLTVDTTTASMLVTITDTVRPDLKERWFSKINGYFAEGKDPAVITAFWINNYWKLTRKAA